MALHQWSKFISIIPFDPIQEGQRKGEVTFLYPKIRYSDSASHQLIDHRGLQAFDDECALFCRLVHT